jgi:hypothetical protein
MHISITRRRDGTLELTMMGIERGDIAFGAKGATMYVLPTLEDLADLRDELASLRDADHEHAITENTRRRQREAA